MQKALLTLIFSLFSSYALQGASEAPKSEKLEKVAAEKVAPVKLRPHAKVAIFDLGGVIFAVDQLQAARKHFGLCTILSYMFRCNNPASMHLKAFKLLRDMRGEVEKKDLNFPQVYGSNMPQAFIDWQLGTLTQEQITLEVGSFLAKHPKYFRSAPERSLVLGVIELMFNAKTRLQYTHLIPSGVALMHWFKQQGYEIYALTNNDKVSMDLLAQKYPQVFALFDKVFCSAEMKKMKPYEDCFKCLLDQTGLTAHQCYFFDDQRENTVAASLMGFHSFLATAKTMPAILSAMKTKQAAQTATELS